MAVVWLATINSLALASEAIHGRFIGTEPINAILMENHSDSFIALRLAKLKQRTIVHIDSHIDLDWVSDWDLKRIRYSRIAEELNQLRLDLLTNPSPSNHSF